MKHVWLLPLTYLLTLTACDKSCHSPISDVVNVDNRTNRSLSLSVCKGEGTSSLSTLAVTPKQTGSLMVGSHDESYVTGGPGAECNRASGAPVNTAVALTTRNFSEVKLCWSNESRSKIAIMEKNDACPAGMKEQTAPIDSCDPTATTVKNQP